MGSLPKTPVIFGSDRVLELAEDNGQASASDRWTGKIRIVHMSDTFMLKLRRVRSCKTLRQLLVVR